LQRLFSPCRYDKSVILNAINYDFFGLVSKEGMYANLQLPDVDTDRPVSLAKLYNTVSCALKNIVVNRFGKHFIASQYFSVFCDFTRCCELRVSSRNQVLTQKLSSISTYYLDHRTDVSNGYYKASLGFDADLGSKLTNLDSLVPVSFFADIDVLVHIILLQNNSIGEGVVNGALGVICSMLQHHNISFSSMDDDFLLTPEAIDLILSSSKSFITSNILENKNKSDSKPNPLQLLTYLQAWIASKLQTLKLLLAFALIRRNLSEDEAISNIVNKVIHQK
jgi:hypothetical protein